MPQIQGVTGEAVVNYCKPVTTPKMGYHRLSRRVNKTDIKLKNSYLTDGRDIKMSSNHRNSFSNKYIIIIFGFVYAQLG
jgi:hypothetical protein